MMRTKDIEQAAAALGNQLAAGISLLDATKQMARAQPKFATFWEKTRAGVASGRPISTFLPSIWPAVFVTAVKAGEESGSLPSVMERIEQTTRLQQEMNKLMYQLVYPFLSGAVGLVVFVIFMLNVIPSISTSLGVGESGLIFSVSSWMAATAEEHGLIIAAGLGTTAVIICHWLSNPENRTTLVDKLLMLPVLGDSLRLIAFGLWAHYMALIDSTGSLTTVEGVRITASTLPASLRSGMLKFADEAILRGLADAADPEKQPEGDSRRTWPFYVTNAFLIAQETGRLDAELMRAAPSLIRDGKALLSRALWVTNAIALLVSALLIVGPLAAYYIQLGISLSEAMQG